MGVFMGPAVALLISNRETFLGCDHAKTGRTNDCFQISCGHERFQAIEQQSFEFLDLVMFELLEQILDFGPHA